MGIRLPLRRFPTTGDHDAGTMLRAAGSGFDARGKMHGETYRTDDAICVVHQSHELPRVGFTHEIDDASQARMPVPVFATLDELNPALEMIDDFLIAGRVPPLGREVVFAARDNNPESIREWMTVQR